MDTTETGDAFVVGLIFGLLTNMPLEKSPNFTNTVSAVKITRK
ncbi:MAG: PfkB family carbohydrate kinase [Candidatus Hodarchaeota archaeon]